MASYFKSSACCAGVNDLRCPSSYAHFFVGQILIKLPPQHSFFNSYFIFLYRDVLVCFVLKVREVQCVKSVVLVA